MMRCAISPAAARVKVAAAGVNFIEVYQRSGQYNMTLPYTPGAEAAGRVRETGSGVSAFRVGDRIGSVGGEGGRRGGKRQRRQRERGRGKMDRGSRLHCIFAVVESVAPLLSTQLIFRSSPFLPPLKVNLT